MNAGHYKVIGRFAFRGHKPGETFTAALEPVLEHRAINRGDIQLLERIVPSLKPGSYTLPGRPLKGV